MTKSDASVGNSANGEKTMIGEQTAAAQGIQISERAMEHIRAAMQKEGVGDREITESFGNGSGILFSYESIG